MIDLNVFINPLSQKQVGPVAMSDKADAELALILHGHGCSPAAENKSYRQVAAISAVNHLDSSYFRKSDWFRRQMVHTFMPIAINAQDPNGPLQPLFHLTKTDNGGHCIVSTDEAVLPESYYDERIVEEVRIETGVI